MNIRIRSERMGELKLLPIRPPHIQNLPESTCYGVSGAFGQILIQHLEAESIAMLHHTVYCNDDEELIYTSQEPMIRLQIILRNSYYYMAKYFGGGEAHERGLLLHTAPDTQAVLKMRGKETYSHISLFYQPEHLKPFLGSMPRLETFLEKVRAGQPMVYNQAYTVAGFRILSLVDYMLNSHYSGHLQKTYFSTLAKDILMETLLCIEETRPSRIIHIVEDEARLIYQAKEILLRDSHLPFSLPQLAAEIGLSPFRLTREFKAIFGMGLKEYLLEARMKNAMQILSSTDTPIAVLARNSGYASAQSFSLAFKNYFGCTPGSIHRRGKAVRGRSDENNAD